jgi:hypothetical protein
LKSKFLIFVGSFKTEWLGQVDTDMGDDVTKRPFFQAGTKEKPRSFTDVFGCILHFASQEFANINFSQTFLEIEGEVQSPQDILNIAIPYLGDPNQPPKDHDKIPENKRKCRLISPHFVAHIVYCFLHSVYPTREAALEETLREYTKVQDLFVEINFFLKYNDS